MLTVSVVIATYNRGEMLVDTLRALLANTYAAFRIVVVDQTREYDERTRRQLAEVCSSPKVEYIKLDVANLPHARNVGARLIDSDIVLYTDDDIACEPEFVARHVECYESEPDLGAVAGRITRPDAADEDGTDTDVGEIGRIRDDGSTIHNFHKASRQFVDWGMGCNMSFSRAALDKAGYFDERYTRTAFFEEVDLFVRLRALGYKVLFEPKAHVIHLKSDDGGARSDAPLSRRVSIIRNRTLFLLNASNHRVIQKRIRSIINLVFEGAGKIARRSRNPLGSAARYLVALSALAYGSASGYASHFIQRADVISSKEGQRG